MSKNLETIEINGTKFEVDLSTAKKIEEFRVGDKVKVLQKSYGENYEIFPGIIIGFEWFKERPTIVVAYLESKYSNVEIKFLYYNKDSEDVELSHTNNLELLITPSDVFSKIDKDIQKKEIEIKELKEKKEYFRKHFEQYFKEFAGELKDLV